MSVEGPQCLVQHGDGCIAEHVGQGAHLTGIEIRRHQAADVVEDCVPCPC